MNVLFSGQFVILLNNRIVNLGYNKVRALFAYLATECDHAHTRDELAGLLWPDQSETTGHKNLRQALMRLRQSLQEDHAPHPFFSISRETIQFNADSDYFSETQAISNLWNQSKAHGHASIETCPACTVRLIQAADLYKGDFLSGLSIPDSLPFEEWLLFVRERDRLQAIEILGILISTSEIRHDHEAVIQYSRRRLVLDPWNEDAYRALMRTLSRTGQRTAALAEYERCRRILADDMAISPSKETIELAEQIRSETAAQVYADNPTFLSNLSFIPVPLSALIGREDELQSLSTLLKRDEIRLVTLMGPPGIGKTRLALHLAELLKEEFDQNVYFISLISITNPDIVINSIAYSLGLDAGIPISPADYLERTINNQKTLLLLDNFEQVPSASAPLLKILQVCPRLKIVVTSQSPLNIRGEQRFYLKPLQLPSAQQTQKTEEILSSPSVRLFFETVQRDIPGISLDSKNAHIAAEICTRLDGLPLAIELAAASVKILSLQQLLNKISEPTTSVLTHLKDQGRNTDTRHQTLWQAFQWSFDLLDPGAQILFSRLGIFNGGWSLEAADAVCNIGDIPTGVMESMIALLENCLIQRFETQSGEYRFSMLATIRKFAVDHMKLIGEMDYLHQRHADYFLTYAKLAEPELSSHNQIEWLERIEYDLDNFRTAVDWTLEHSPNEALQLCVALFPYWHIRSYLEEGRNYLIRACELNPHPTHFRARGLAAAGLLSQRQGDFSHARKLIDQSFSIARQLNDRPGLAYALNNLSIVMMSAGEQEQAFVKANESLAICLELKYDLGVARAQMSLGQIAINQDDLPSAWSSLELSHKFWRKNGDDKNLGLCLINLGRIRISQGKYPEAEKLLEESLSLSRKIKDHHWEIVAMWNLGDIHRLRGNQSAAQTIFQEVYQHTIKLGDRFFEALTLDRLGYIAVMNKDYNLGVDFFDQSLDIGQIIGANWIVANALSDLGFTAYLQNESIEAYRLLFQSAHMFLSQNEQADLISSLERLAMVSLRLEKLEQAVRIISSAEMWRRSKGEPVPPLNIESLRKALDELKECLSVEIFWNYWVEGQELSIQQIAAELIHP